MYHCTERKTPQGVKCIFFLFGLVNLSNIKSIPCFSPFPPFYSFLPQCIKPDRSINSYLWGYQVLVWRVRILVAYHNWDDQCIHIYQLLCYRGLVLSKFHQNEFTTRTQIYVLNADSFTYTDIKYIYAYFSHYMLLA